MNRYRSAVCAVLCVMFASVATANAEPALSTPREIDPVGLVLKKLDKAIDSGALTAGSGRVWVDDVIHPQPTSGIRLHFVVVSPGTATGWRIRILKGVQVVEEIDGASAEVARGKFWSKVVNGSAARVELWSDGDPTGIHLQIDEYAFEILPVAASATHGPDNKVAIAAAPADVRALGPPIARLTIMTDKGGSWCTGFMVTDSLLVTNEHCIANPTEAVSTVAEFGFDSSAATPKSYRAVKLEEADKDLDYAVVRMAAAPGQAFQRVKLDPAGNPSDGVALAIVQHPAGLPKMASVIDCNVSGQKRIGRGGTGTDFGHTCDTLGGSSGSPVFSLASRKVVGLHHLGFHAGNPNAVNQAVNLDQILADLRRDNLSVYAEIMAATATQ